MMYHHLRKPTVLVGIVLACLLLYGGAIAWISISTVHNTSRLDLAEAKAQAQEAAAHQAEVTVCKRGLVTGPTTLVILEELRSQAQDRANTSQAALDADPDSVLTPLRKASVLRSQEAADGLSKFIVQVKRQTPTADQCARIADRYGIGQPQEADQ